MARLPLLTAAQWKKIAPLLPVFKGGKSRLDDRRIVSGILLALATSCPWRELPPIYGNANTLQSRYRRWRADGTLDAICKALNFEPPSAYDRHQHQGYGTIQRRAFQQRNFNPWLWQAGSLADVIAGRDRR